MVAQPTGTVTLVFTDIEGSTRLLSTLGPARYREALAGHRVAVREAFGRHRGYEVDYEGDAFFYAFASAVEAVAAVEEATAALDGGPITIRVGILIRGRARCAHQAVPRPRTVGARPGHGRSPDERWAGAEPRAGARADRVSPGLTRTGAPPPFSRAARSARPRRPRSRSRARRPPSGRHPTSPPGSPT